MKTMKSEPQGVTIRSVLGKYIDTDLVETCGKLKQVDLIQANRKPTPYEYEDFPCAKPEYGRGTICIGDPLEIMQVLPDDAFGGIITGPPLNLTDDDNSVLNSWGMESQVTKKRFDQDNEAMRHAHYVEWQRSCLTEMVRILKPKGAIYYFQSPRTKHGRWWDPMTDLLQGFSVRQKITWVRQSAFGMPDIMSERHMEIARTERSYEVYNNHASYHYLPVSQDIYVIAGEGYKISKPGYGVDVWHYPESLHYPPYPRGIARKILSAFGIGPWTPHYTADLHAPILDPFMGYGAVTSQCHEYCQSWVGITNSVKYVLGALKRMKKEKVLR